MVAPNIDNRSADRRARDEAVTAESPQPPPVLPPDAKPLPVEAYLARRRHPVAVAGIVENGVVRPLDESIKLPEHSRVIIVASE